MTRLHKPFNYKMDVVDKICGKFKEEIKMKNINTNYDAWRDKMSLFFVVGIVALICALLSGFIDFMPPIAVSICYILGFLGILGGAFCCLMSYISDMRFYLEKLYELKSKEN